MGNEASRLGDEPSSNIADKNLDHFDHHFKGELHTTSGPVAVGAFGERSFGKNPIILVCKAGSMEIKEEIGLSGKQSLEISYFQISSVGWDHGSSEVKISFRGSDEVDNFIIITLSNSIELEGEMKLRFNGAQNTMKGFKMPGAMYIGMFAGATKPKPFQRKRPNLSKLKAGLLPTLNEMRSLALQLHKGSYVPCLPGESRRMELAMQYIYDGYNEFDLLSVRGISGVSSQWRHDSVISIMEDSIVFRPFGRNGNQTIEFVYEDFKDWNAIDNDHMNKNDSGIEIISKNGDSVYFGVRFIRDVKHTLEFFWNRYQLSHGGEPKLGSTHGRPIVTCTTLSGDIAAPEAPTGSCEVIDQDGMIVRPGSRLAPRRSSIASGIVSAPEPTVVPHENRLVKDHWHRVVVHQGWLLKKGGVGIGNAKSWIKRYFVLYRTSQGHFLIYYGDFTECPLYTQEKHQRNIVDLAKATFIRPGSNKAEFADTPPHSFDIVTTEREWTLCAESQENMQKWLKLLNRAIDEDVAILPDEDLIFKVKPKVDPLAVLPALDYSTALKVSANGVSVTSPDPVHNGLEREHFFWVYTDFYKWSLLSQAGKLALLVNVFADSSFSRRNEFIFRTKEAVRLATAIEYYIEKFMSVMHVRLEVMESSTPKEEQGSGISAAPANTGMHQVAGEAFEDHVEAQDLLDMYETPAGESSTQDGGSASASGFDDPFGDSFGSGSTNTTTKTSAPPVPAAPSASMVSDPFGDDPFGSAPPPPPAPKPVAPKPVAPKPVAPVAPAPAPVPPKSSPLVDLFDVNPSPPPAAPPKPPVPAAAPLLDLFGDAPAAPAAPVTRPVAPASSVPEAPKDVFGSQEPFGSSDIFSNFSIQDKPAPKNAPPLSSQQVMQHKNWLLNAIVSGGGMFYDDGALGIVMKYEIRGCQGRYMFELNNKSPGKLENLKMELQDPAGLIRYQFANTPMGNGTTSLPITLEGLSKNQCNFLVECLKPSAPVPSVKISYSDIYGARSNTLMLPLMVTTFNEPLVLPSPDFQTKWNQLISPGLEAQEVFRPSTPIVPAMIKRVFVQGLKFGLVNDPLTANDNSFSGAATLRTGATTPNGEKISVGCLAKVELNGPSNSIRITLRTLHPAATTAMMDAAKTLLA